tara:strand:- start:4521 stop:5873 length:1353 start_codon:yes stop_codon:yes gene_type:complete
MIKTINPYNNKMIMSYFQHTDDDINMIIQNVNDSYKKWKNISIKNRSFLLLDLAENLESNKLQYGKLITEEIGKPIKESILEIIKCASVCKYYADNSESFLRNDYIKTENFKSYVRYNPLGVVFGIMPWNFPFWQVFRFVAPSLMAGNVCLLKHASNTLGSAVLIDNIINKLSPIKNIFRNVIVKSDRVGGLIKDSRIAAVTLTGGETAGMNVAAIAGSALKKCVLELGGSDPFIVLHDADIKTAAKNAIKARFLNSGQSCIAAKRFIVHKSVYSKFIAEVKKYFDQFVLGDPLDSKTTIGPLAKKEFLIEIDKIVKTSIKEGAKLIYGGKINSCFYEPTLLVDVTENMKVFNEETFGPIMCITKAETTIQAISLANQSEYGLSSSIWTSDIKNAEKISSEIESGAVFINKLSYSDPRLPFGGIKKSGYGRELSKEGIMEFVNKKTIVVS